MLNVLLIGDNPIITRLTSRLIERNGLDTTVWTDFFNMPKEKPDLLLFDCGISPESGFKKYKDLIEYYNRSKILWVSSEERDEIPALELGADDWIKKPFNTEVFITRIKRLCRHTGRRY